MSLAPHVLVGAELRDAEQGAHVAVDPATLHHLRRVLRLAEGAELSLTDGAGNAALAVLDGEHARLTTSVCEVPLRRPDLVLAQALSKGRRAEDAVRVACELGVGSIVPVIAERTQGRPDARASAALVERWRSVAVSALEQSRGVRLAGIAAPVDGLDGLDGLADPDGVLRLLAVPGGEPLPEVLAEAGGGAGTVVLAIGPEGGWSDAEVVRAMASGWRSVGLGPTVLRTEHAGPVAVAVTAALLGHWRATEGA